MIIIMDVACPQADAALLKPSLLNLSALDFLEDLTQPQAQCGATSLFHPYILIKYADDHLSLDGHTQVSEW